MRTFTPFGNLHLGLLSFYVDGELLLPSWRIDADLGSGGRPSHHDQPVEISHEISWKVRSIQAVFKCISYIELKIECRLLLILESTLAELPHYLVSINNGKDHPDEGGLFKLIKHNFLTHY
jgi:hypothetical protein